MSPSAESQPAEKRLLPGPAEETPHILVVDDDTRIRTLLHRYLVENGYRVTTAETAEQARARLAGLAFDLLVLDIMMPGENGLDLTRSLRTTSQVPILLLTARGDPEDRIAGLEVGADDYLAKPFQPRELLLRIEAIFRRARPVQPLAEEVRLGAFRFIPERGELMHADEPVRLTSAEAMLLTLLARHPGETVSRAELCAKTNAGLERSVDVQITRLRRKIEPDPRSPTYLQTVRGVGYVLVPD